MRTRDSDKDEARESVLTDWPSTVFGGHGVCSDLLRGEQSSAR